jgi:D-alanyl-D-alanine-carboxypeptidase/D-alanyl-D-alanine-endopeptidase
MEAGRILCLLLLFVSCLTAFASQQKYPDANNVRAILQDRIDHYRKSEAIVVGLIDSSGTQITGYGKISESNPQAPDGDTVFEIGSMTKVFTSTLLSDMVQRGELKLDDPIAKFLPSSAKVPTRGRKEITFLDLATHTSGLPRLPSNLYPKDPDNPYADYTISQMYDFLSNYALTRDIGSQYEYSNFGAGLLGHILSLKAGMDYESLVLKRICVPLGMKDTRITLTPEMESHWTSGHNEMGKPVPHWDVPTLAGAGALRSTANDLLLFLAANMGLKKTLLYPAMQQMQTPRRPTGTPDMQIGLGWHILQQNGSNIVWHNGGTGGFHSFFGFDQTSSIGVVVLSNSTNSIDDIALHLLNPKFELAKLEVPVEHKAIQLDPKIYDAYAGYYQLAPNFILTISTENGHLYSQATGQARVEIFPESENEFFLTVVNAQITFEKDSNGTVTGLILHQNGDHRAPRLGPDYQPPSHKEVSIDPKILQKYVGKYELVPGIVFDVTMQNEKLMAQLTGQSSFQIFPESETEFFYKVVDAQITFQLDGNGNVTGLILHQGGNDHAAKRMKNPPGEN